MTARVILAVCLAAIAFAIVWALTHPEQARRAAAEPIESQYR